MTGVRLLVAPMALLLVLAGLALASPRVEAAGYDLPTATRADGNTYALLWVKPKQPKVLSVMIAGKQAVRRKDGYWEVSLLGPQRDRVVRRVEIRTPGHTWAGPVRFSDVVDW